MAFPKVPDPPTELGRLRIMSSSAGIRVSPLALGGGNIGEKWNDIWGYMNKENAFKLLDAYYEAGGNFIDTANGYHDEQSEMWLGEWMSARQNRDHLVLATKYTENFRYHTSIPYSPFSINRPPPSATTPSSTPQISPSHFANHAGNSRRSLHLSVAASLSKLQTSYIDIMYVHWWDYTTSIPEVMDSLHALVQQGKIMYLGVSDTPAWIVAVANGYARQHGKTEFSIYQGKWNVLVRDLEREILPMARHFGMAIVPWGVLGEGKLYEEDKGKGEGGRGWGGAGQMEEQRAVSEALARVGRGEVGHLVWVETASGGKDGVEGEGGNKRQATVTQVALAYVLTKAEQLGVYNVFPSVGGRKVEQLKANIAALSIRLTDEQLAYLESVKSFELGFPHDFIGKDPNITGEMGQLSWSTPFLAFPGARPGRPN